MATAEHETNGVESKPGPRDNAPGRSPRPVVEYRDGWEQSVPRSLTSRRQWVVWSFEWREGKPAVGGPKPKPATPGKWTKVLYQPEAPVSKARSDAPKTWSSFQRAIEAWKREQNVFDGIGYVFSKDDPFCGIDFDACLDGEGNPHGWADHLLSLTSDTYREVSPSGRGVKAIVSADLGDRKGTNARGIGGKDALGSAIEIYDRGRFFAITGSAWGDCPNEIEGAEEGQKIADTVYAHIQAVRAERDAEKKRAAKKKSSGRNGHGSNGSHHQFFGRPPVDDQQLLYLARTATNGHEFAALYDQGDLSSYASDSEADGALCCRLAFWTQKDAARIERLWLASSIGQRDKVQERADYRSLTIATAIEKTDNVYRPTPTLPMPEVANQARAPLNSADDIPWTEQGLAERVIKQYGHLFRFCKPWKKWLVWDETRWSVDSTLKLDRFIKGTIRRMQVEEVATIPDPDIKKAFVDWARSCESKRVLESIIRLLQGQEGVPVTPETLDADPWLFNCPNGTVDLRTGELRPHRKTDLITKVCPVEFHPDAACPLWDATLEQFLPDPELRAWVDRLFGYTLTGTIRDHVLAIFYGLGANGKTTILNALYSVMGTDYAYKAPRNLLMEKRNNAHPTEQASLFGKRLVITSETGEGERFDEGLVKEITGDEPITARRMREDPWSFRPSHKLILSTNHKPSVKGSDEGIWRRLKLVEFGVSLTSDQQDTSFSGRLKEEWTGILARAIRGCLDWQKEGLNDCQAITDATKEYRDEEDTLGLFITERCTVDPLAGPTKAFDLYSSYTMWAESYKMKPMSIVRFGKLITSKGVKKKRNNGIEYTGISLGVGGLNEGEKQGEHTTDESDETGDVPF